MKARPTSLISTAFMGAVLAALVCVSCSQVGGFGANRDDDQGEGDGDSLQSKPAEETGKPTEDAESIPGYLVDPQLIELLEKDEGYLVRAPAGTVKVADAASDLPGTLTVAAYSVGSEAIALAKSGKLVLPAKRMGRKPVEADGSFEIQVSPGEDQAIVITVGSQSSEEDVSLEGSTDEKPHTVYKFPNESGPFAALGVAEAVSGGQTKKIKAIISFDADSGDEPGTILVSLKPGPERGEAVRIVISQRSGPDAPEEGCKEGSILDSEDDPFPSEHLVKDLAEGEIQSFRLCVFSGDDEILQSFTASGVEPKKAPHVSGCRLLATSCQTYCQGLGRQCVSAGLDAEASDGRAGVTDGTPVCQGLITAAATCDTVSALNAGRCRCE